MAKRSVVHMRTVWEWRRMIESGWAVREIYGYFGGRYSEALIRSYTKKERERVKQRGREFVERAELQKLLRMAHEQQLEEERKARQLRWDRGEYFDNGEE